LLHSCITNQWQSQISSPRRQLTTETEIKQGKYKYAWTLPKVDQKYLECFEMWCWRRMEKISWTDRVRNEVVLHRVKEERNILHTIKRRKATWIGHILRRNCLLKHVNEGKLEGRIEMTGRRGRRSKQLLDYLKEREDTRN
jgi:hypothetical protein